MTAVYLVILFFAKVLDNTLGTAKTILVQRNRCVLAGVALGLSNFIYLSITKDIVTSDSSLALATVSIASGVGCCLAVALSNRFSKDKTYVNVIMSDSAQVQCIPASIKKTTEHSEEDPLMVAPYCRVSTDSKDQLASYELQCQYYKEYVSKHPGWRLYDIYADEGISGTSVKKRTDFLRMIDDCKAGKINMIIMKNIARFARNVVDCVATVRMLKALDKPVAVYFEDIAINTLTQTGELLMVVMAAIAQGESEAKSESVKWGFQKRFEKGLPKLADLYGYTRDKRLLEIYEPEANVVRLIYQMFYDDRTIPEICYILNQQGILSPRGGRWTYSTVKTILTNEKYSGDVLMQKTVTVDIFSHRSIRNDGRANQFFIQGYHKAIIPRALWLEVQQILKGENVVPVPSVDEVADLSASDVPRILDGFFVIKPRKDGNNEYLRQL